MPGAKRWWWLRAVGLLLSPHFPGWLKFYRLHRSCGHGRRACVAWAWRMFIFYARRG